jgi:hypothetical protein
MILPVVYYWGINVETYSLLTFIGGVLVGIGVLLFIITAAVYFFTREEN